MFPKFFSSLTISHFPLENFMINLYYSFIHSVFFCSLLNRQVCLSVFCGQVHKNHPLHFLLPASKYQTAPRPRGAHGAEVESVKTTLWVIRQLILIMEKVTPKNNLKAHEKKHEESMKIEKSYCS